VARLLGAAMGHDREGVGAARNRAVPSAVETATRTSWIGAGDYRPGRKGGIG
jgi:hypothetical protein